MKPIALPLSLVLAMACSSEGAGNGASANPTASAKQAASSSAASPATTTTAAPSAAAKPAARLMGEVAARDGKLALFTLELPEGYADRTPKEMAKFSRMYALSDNFKEGFVIEIMAPIAEFKDAATMTTIIEKQGGKVLRSESADGGFWLSVEPKEGAGKLLLLHAVVDQGRLYCRGNAAGAAAADATKAVEFMVAACRSAKARLSLGKAAD